MGSSPSKVEKNFKEDDSDFTSGSSSDSDYPTYRRENDESISRHFDELKRLGTTVKAKEPTLKEIETYKELSTTVKRMHELDAILSTLTYSKQKNIRIQQEAARLVCTTGAIEAMCEILINCLKFTSNFSAIEPAFTAPSSDSKAPEEDQYLWQIFWYTIQYLYETTNVCVDVSQRVIKMTWVGFGGQEIHDLGKVHLEQKNYNQTKNEQILECLMKVFYNLARTDKSNAAFDKALRGAGLHEILPPFIHTECKEVRLAALATLAEIQKNIKKEAKFDTSTAAVKLVVEALAEANDAKNGRSKSGWTAKELTHVLGVLARNKEYKILLVSECGALPVLVKRAKDTHKKQKRVTTRVLYSLSFAKDNHPAMVDGKDGVVELFLELRKNKDKKIRKAAIGGLWNMRVQMIDSKTHVELGKEFLRNSKRPKNPFDDKGSSDEDD